MSEHVERPLAGLRVLDLSRVLAGPYVGRMLADLGADVVKVEPPEGDVTRKWGKVRAGRSGYFTQQNVGKRGLCIDLRADGGPDLVRRLAAHADVVIENFRPGVMAQYGLDYERLHALNPRLVMLSISGFGQNGPESQRPAYAAVVQAESGIVHRQAALSGTARADLRISVADMNAALHGLVGVLAALLLRSRTGRGQHLDISMLESMLATDDYVHLAIDGVREDDGVVVNEVWEVVGGPLVIAGDPRWVWQRLQATHGLTDPTPKDAPVFEKAKNRHAVIAAFFNGFRDRAALLQALQRADLAYGEVKDTRSALLSPSVVARGAIAKVPDGEGGVREVVQSPYRYSDARAGASGPAPRRGAHNAEVLREWLELAPSEIDALSQAGVLLRE